MWLMWPVNYLKVGLIKIADWYTKIRSKFDEFTREPMIAIDEPDNTLIAKEAMFFDHFVSRMQLNYGKAVIWNYRWQSDGYIDLGDQALWHGVSTFMLSLRYRYNPTAQMQDLLVRSANGMLLHQRTEVEARPRLVRGVRGEGDAPFQDDASNDTLTGHLLGIYGLLKYGTGAARQTGAVLARNMAESLLDNNFKLTNVDGSVTTYGKLENGYLTDGLNLSLCLVTLKLASYAFGGNVMDYELPYQMLVKKYGPIIPYGYVTLDQIGHDYDAHRAMIAYSILADIEKDHDINRLYVQGLMRGWTHDRKARNPWMYYLLRRIVLMDPADVDGVLTRLSEIEVANQIFVVERVNSKDEKLWNEKGIKFFQWRGALRASQPLPMWMIGSQDFPWQRNQYSVDDWLGRGPGMEHSGLGFMVAYWGLREIGLIR